MKTGRIGPDGIFHRYLTPKWAFQPTSGAGAAIDGGRFNRPGVEALYLSRSAQTALEEYKQGTSITPPATLAAYKITLAEVADLSQGFDPDIWDNAWKEWDCAWPDRPHSQENTTIMEAGGLGHYRRAARHLIPLTASRRRDKSRDLPGQPYRRRQRGGA